MQIVNNNKLFSLFNPLQMVLLFGLAGVAQAGFTNEGNENLLYRYINQDGVLVIDDNVPTDYISKGYTILSEKGFVLDTVPPELNPEQRVLLEQEQREQEKSREQKRRKEWLLERYTDTEDIVIARDRQMGSIETLISIAQSTIRKLKEEEVKELEFAAAEERKGEVSQTVLNNLSKIRTKIKETELELIAKEKARDQSLEKFELMIEEMKIIQTNKQHNQ